MLLVSGWATVKAHLHPALYLPNSDAEPDLLTWLFGLTLDPSHHYQLCLQSESLFGLDLLYSCTGSVGLETFLLGLCSSLPCCESELSAHLPFPCCSLRHIKSFSLGPRVCLLIYTTETFQFESGLPRKGTVPQSPHSEWLHFLSYTVLFTSWFYQTLLFLK